MYALRLKLKNDKNPSQGVIKLLMTSMYGTTIIKPVETDTIIAYTRYYFEKYISLNYSYIDIVLEIIVRYYIIQVNQLCLILIMFTVGLAFYPCLKGL